MTIFEEALWQAVEKNKINYVKELIKFFLNNDLPLEDKPSWYFTNRNGENLIYHAISCFGKEINSTEKLQRKDILNLIFDTLFKEAPDAIECLTTDNKTCFWLATYYRSLETLERLLNLNKKNLPILINKRDKVKQSRETPLQLACRANNVQIVEFLLKNKADVNKTNAYGNTALHIACTLGYFKITTLLIQYNADIKQVNNDENTPLHLALAKENLKIANLLLVRIEELNFSFPLFKKNKAKETVLFLAAGLGYETFIKRIINYNPSLIIITEKNESLLYAACKGLCIDLIRYLLASNLDISYQETKSCFEPLSKKLSDSNISNADHKKIILIINLLLHYGLGIDNYLPKKILENKEHLSCYLNIEIFKDNQGRIIFPGEVAKNHYHVQYTSCMFLIDTTIYSQSRSPKFLTLESAIHNYKEFKNKKFEINYVIHHLPCIFGIINNIKDKLPFNVKIEYVKILEKIQKYCKKIPTEIIFADELPEFKAELRKNVRHNFGELPEYLQALKKELYEINKYSSHLPIIQPQIEAFESLSHIIHQLHVLAESIRRNVPKHRTLKAYIDYHDLENLGLLSLFFGVATILFMYTVYLIDTIYNNNIFNKKLLLISFVFLLGFASLGAYALYCQNNWDNYPDTPFDYPIKYIPAYERNSLEHLKNIILEIIENFKKNNKIVKTNIYKNLENYLKIDNHSTISSTLESIKELINNFINHRNAIYSGDENVFSIYAKSRYNFFSPPIVFIKQEHQSNLNKHRNTK